MYTQENTIHGNRHNIYNEICYDDTISVLDYLYQSESLVTF
jgi:hypothetical protein